MSTTSTVTASVVRDLTLIDKLEIMNHICILAATQSDGTHFCPDSFQEEDMVELCVGLGQAHPEMITVMCLFAAATAWHHGPIRLCIHLPADTQVREYMATRSRHPSGA